MNRRRFIQTLGVATAALSSESLLKAATNDTKAKDPRWRGFNLTEMVGPNPARPEFQESDLALMAEWGFNFVRIPMSYWVWSKPEVSEWKKIDEKEFERLDRLVEKAAKYDIHVNMGLHRIPGYCINGREKEPFDLFTSDEEGREAALDAACHHWTFIANRYKSQPKTRVSYDLMNEPPFMKDPAPYEKVVRALVAAIRKVDPQRTIVADGIDIGNTPVPGLADLGIMQSTRGYEPKPVSHYKATWVPAEEWAPWPDTTSWPITAKDGTVWDKAMLKKKLIDPWKAVEAKGVGVHVGEWGAFTQTPHHVVLAWMKDFLELWQEAGWGWAMWNFRGPFGPLNSGRPDVKYEDYRGMKLDREMIELLRSH